MFTKSIGNIFLSVYLILVGVTVLIPALAIPGIVIGVIALIAGVLILLGK